MTSLVEFTDDFLIKLVLIYDCFHVQLLDENRWYNFDDSHISPINEDDVKSAAAYVLFYRRVRT